MATESSPALVRVYICSCGPLIGGTIDLEKLRHSLRSSAAVEVAEIHATLCSPQGQTWLQQDLKQHPTARVVLAACSPKQHEVAFRQLCGRAGIHPYMMAMANIREQCGWVTADRDSATRKAEALVQAAIARCRVQQPIDARSIAAQMWLSSAPALPG